MYGAARVQIPKNNLDNMHSLREEDGTLETMDPQDLLDSILQAENPVKEILLKLNLPNHMSNLMDLKISFGRFEVLAFDDIGVFGWLYGEYVSLLDAIDADEDITLVSIQDDADKEMFDVDTLFGDEVFIEQEVDVKKAYDEVNVVEEVVEIIKTAKLIVDVAEVSSARVSVSAASAATTFNAATTTTATITTVDDDDIQTKIDDDHEQAKRMQAQEQEEFYIDEKSTLFQQLLENIRKHFAAKRAEEKRNKPPTKSQKRKIMCTYLKNMEGYKLKDLKLKEFDSIYDMFDRAFKRSQELKNVSYHKLYVILKQHQHEVNEIRAKKIARAANPLALVAQQQPVYHPQTHPTHYNQNSSTRSQQVATKNRGKAIVNSPQPIYDQAPSMADDDDDEMSKDKEIDKLMALIFLSFKKIYKPTNNNLRTSSNTSRANQDNSTRIHRNAGYEHQRLGNVAGARETVGSTVVQKSGIQCYNCKEYGHVARECQKPKRVKDAAYHREKMLLCKQEEAGIQLNEEQADWKDDTDDESDDQELEAHYIYMAKLQQVSPDVDDSGPIFDKEPEQKKDEDADLAKERELLASLIEKLKCEIDESKNHNTLLEASNKVLVGKLKSEIKDFKNKNKSLKEANNKLSEENDLLYADFKKSKVELKRRDSIEYAS
nr:hypothetical protein [Tanacetum cinerariifolium]